MGIHCTTLCVDKENGKFFGGHEYAVRVGCPTLSQCTQACNVHGIVPGLADDVKVNHEVRPLTPNCNFLWDKQKLCMLTCTCTVRAVTIVSVMMQDYLVEQLPYLPSSTRVSYAWLRLSTAPPTFTLISTSLSFACNC